MDLLPPLNTNNTPKTFRLKAISGLGGHIKHGQTMWGFMHNKLETSLPFSAKTPSDKNPKITSMSSPPPSPESLNSHEDVNYNVLHSIFCECDQKTT